MDAAAAKMRRAHRRRKCSTRIPFRRGGSIRGRSDSLRDSAAGTLDLQVSGSAGAIRFGASDAAASDTADMASAVASDTDIQDTDMRDMGLSLCLQLRVRPLLAPDQSIALRVLRRVSSVTLQAIFKA